MRTTGDLQTVGDIPRFSNASLATALAVVAEAATRYGKLHCIIRTRLFKE